MKKNKFPIPDGKPVIVPSVLSADFTNLNKSLATVKKAGWIQVDVMDGVFVPNISFGPGIIPAVSKTSGLNIDSHLMISDPLKYVDAFAKAGSDLITVHVETKTAAPAVKRIKELGLKAGMALRPKTPVKKIIPHLKDLDLVLVMTVEPGFGGQKFMEDMMDKVLEIRRLINMTGRKIWLQVDGGINENTAETAVMAGADSLVMGSALFGAKSPSSLVKKLSKKLSLLH